ncbi:glycoside hydrolase [Archangium gephyra]|nr:glycoside hydrolase [Archangium gephyra]
MKKLKGGHIAAGAALLAGLAATGAAAAVRRLDGSGRVDPAKADITLDELLEVMPRLSPSQAREYLPLLNAALREGGLFDTVDRLEMFLAQIGHESDHLKRWLEVASGEDYEGRTVLGNTVPGDGPRFKGRGPIQLTGRYNYTQAGKALGLDLVNRPEDAALPSVGFRVAVWYWNSRNLSAKADALDFVGVTKGINGGTNGLEQRQLFYSRARAAFAHRRGTA